MATINQFRALIPGGDKMSDYDIVREVSKTLGQDEKDIAAKLRFGNSSGGLTSQQFSSSIDRYQAGLYGVAEEVAGVVGAKDTSSWLAKQRSENELRGDISAQKARKMGAIDTFADVKGLGDFGSYAKGLAIQSAPYLVEALAGGVIARGAMTGTRAALTAAEVSGDVAAAARAKSALNIGSSAGVVGASYPSAVGDVLSNQREQTGGRTDAASAFALGVPYAALNVLGVEGALARGQLFRNSINFLDNVQGAKGVLARTTATGTVAAGKEGFQETAQEGVNQVGRMAVDPTEQFFSEKAKERFGESFAGGATLGGFIGGGAGGWRRSESFIPGSNTSTNQQTGQPAANDIQQVFQQNQAAAPTFDMASQMGGTAGRVDPLAGRSSLYNQQPIEEQTVASPITSSAPAVSGGTTDIAQSQAAAQQQQQQQTQAAFAAQQQQKEAERAVFLAETIGLSKPEGQRWDFFGKPIFGPAIQEAAAANAEQVGSMNGTQALITRAINKANEQTGGKLVNVPFNPLKAADSVRKTFEKVAEAAARFQIAHVGSVEEAAQILEQLSQSTKGAQLEQLNAIHQALTGKDTTGYIASQQTKGATNVQQQQQLQTTTGVGAVPVQGGTGEGGGGISGNVQPSRLQSLISGSQPQGQTIQQTGQPSGEGIRTGTSVTPDLSGGQPAPGQVSEAAPATQAAVSSAAPVITEQTTDEDIGAVPGQSQEQPDEEQRVQEVPNLIRNALRMIFKSDRKVDLLLFLTEKSNRGNYGELAEQYKVSEDYVKELAAQATVAKGQTHPPFIINNIDKFYEAVKFQAEKMNVSVLEALEGLESIHEAYQLEETNIVEEADLQFNAGLQIQNRSERTDVKGKKTGKSDLTNTTNIVDENNKSDTLNQKYTVLMEEMVKALEANDESKIAKLQTEIADVVGKIRKEVKLEQGRTRAKAGKVKAEKEEKALTGEVSPTGEDIGERATTTEADEKVEAAPKEQLAEEEVEAEQEEEVKPKSLGEKLAEESSAKRKVERKGLAVGDTVVNPKMGTGVVEGFSGNGAETIVTVKFQSGLTKNLSVALAKLEKTNAVQVDSGKAVVKEEIKPAKPVRKARQVKAKVEAPVEVKAEEVKTSEEAAEAAWNKVADTMPSAPKFADLTKAQRDNFIDFGSDNWTEADVTLELVKLAKVAPAAPATEIVTEKRQTISDVVAETEKPSRVTVTPKTVLDTNKFVYHAVRSDEDIETIMRDGIAPGTNVSTTHDGQAFSGEGDTILVLPKGEAGAKGKDYQQDSVTSAKVFPVAILKDDSLLSTEGDVAEDELLNEEEEIRNALAAFDKTLGITEDQRISAITKAEVGNKAIAKQLFGDFYDRIMKLSRRQDVVWDELDSVEQRNALPTLESYTQYEIPVFPLDIQYNENTDKVKLKVEEQVEAPVKELTAEEIIEESPEAAEINPEQQAILEEPVAALPEAQVVRLENHYGVKRGTSAFFTKLQEDVTAYATKGAQAVSAAIRDIVRAIHAGVLATAMIFNPSVMTKNSEVVIIAPRTVSQMKEVRAEVPAAAKANMSKAAQEAYSTIYPSIAAKLKADNKFFVLTDKPNAQMFIFSPDGSLFLQKKVLIGKTVGDYYKGNTDIVQNRITPAGLFTMGLRDAKRGGGEARTAGDYDFGKVFVLDKAIGGEYSVTLFHSVYTKEKDAQQRLAALQKQGAADSRYSFGCINVDKATYGSLVTNNLQQMDGAALFIVPDKQELVGEFLTGPTAQNKANKDELIRTPFTPKTETVTTTTPAPAQGQATPSKVSMAGREEDVKFGKNIDNETHNEEPYLKENGRTLDLIVNGKVTKTFELVSQGLWDAFKGRPEGQENLLRNKEPKEVKQQAQKELSKARSLHTEYAPLTRNEKLALQAVADKDVDTLRLYEESTSLRQSILQIVIQAVIDPEGSFPSYVLTDVVANRNGDTKQASNILKYAPSSMMKGVTMPVGLESAQFGKNAAPTKPYTAESLTTELKTFMRVDSLGRNVIIVDDVAELEDLRDQAVGWSNDRAFGWTRSGKAILIASRIQEGQGRAKFMHEVGSHLGLDQMLAEKDIVALASQISKWANLNNNSKESVLARKAIERVGNANVADEDVMSELIAYFVEEAILSGVDPSAASKMTGAFGNWFRTLWAGFKNAVRKLGFKPESLTAQDVVNMAYGAARLEIAGTWHGSNAEFRSFSAKKIGTGTGGQLWGKGTYLADARATSEGFAAIDDDSMQGTKAVLYRVDIAVANDEWLNAKQPMNAQSDTVRKGLESLRLYDPVGEASIKWFKTQEAKYGAEQFAAMLDKVGVKGVKYPDASGGFSFVVFNNKNINRVQTNVGVQTNGANDAVPKFDWQNVKFGINPAATVDETINRLPPFVRTSTRSLTTTLLYQAKNAVYASAVTEDVVKLASKYMKSAKDYIEAQYARQTTRIQFEQRINKILSDFDKLSGEYKGTGANSVNKFIKDSTVSGKWGYYPDEKRVGTELFTVDPDMKLRFDAFDESAQNVIKDVFEHGYEALMLKKKAVEAAIDREFADREKAVMGDADQIAELAKEKKLLLAREAKVRGINVSSPYAYLGRYGDYVVVAKSAEFKYYEERAKLNDWDVKQAKQWLQDNISNADHYVVQFAETQAEADVIADQLHATGNYDIMPEDAGVKEAEESYTGGGDIHLAVSRLRNLLQRQVSDGDMSSVNFHSMNKMVGDLYLMTVAEASARKSEMQRKNVAGADDNMMRNLATSGRADAHFLSTLEHNDDITDSMERMRSEAKNHRREAMPIYNELVKRQANSMEYKTPAPLAIALNRMNTIWSLAFSPAYYLQQILQTAVLSVPYIGARIGYSNAVSQVSRGYKDIAGLVKGLGVNDNIDFSKAPADVRDMLNKLVGMGRIDTSMDVNERATADEKGIFAKVMYKIQGVNNRVEAVNRSVAAIAAYRGYLARYGNNNTEAATQYAAQVVFDTHGAYDGFNTPRALAGNIGRVVGQFRRFQIIQLSMLARLMHNAFKGASADEKMVARKALGFITAQMAVVGGAMAVPFVSQIAWMMSKIFGDPDEPDNFEFKLRRLIDNKVVSDLLLRGVPAALGVDVSDKLGMGRVASILPFSQGDLTSRSGAEKILVAAMGPSASMSMKFADAFGMILKGDYYKGLEMAMPNGFANVMKAGRFTAEGITMRNGDLVLKPEDFSVVDTAFQAVGLPTNTVTDRQFTQQVKAEYDKFYAQRSTDIKGDYVKAYRDNDAKGMSQAREEFQQMEDSRVANGYKRQPMSDLLRAPMAAMKRERGVIGGVETSKQNRRFVELASQI